MDQAKLNQVVNSNRRPIATQLLAGMMANPAYHDDPMGDESAVNLVLELSEKLILADIERWEAGDGGCTNDQG